jgi:hypothetical protein
MVVRTIQSFRTIKDSAMTDTELQKMFEAYLDAFAATSSTEQERLLRSSVAEDVVYTNPGVEGRGLPNLLRHISVFQERFPGHRFRVNWFRQQHGQLLSEWTQVGQGGEELVTAHSYGRLNELGRIDHLAGFWSPGAV